MITERHTYIRRTSSFLSVRSCFGRHVLQCPKSAICRRFTFNFEHFLMSTPTFTVNSGIGRFQFKQPKCPTPLASSHVEAKGPAPGEKSIKEVMQEYNAHLAHLKEQYLKLRTQYQQEEKNGSMKLLNLERQLRSEQKLYEDVESQIAELTAQGLQCVDMGSAAVVEQIWNLMQEYKNSLERPAVKISSDPYKSKSKHQSCNMSVIDEDEEPCFVKMDPIRRHDYRRH